MLVIYGLRNYTLLENSYMQSPYCLAAPILEVINCGFHEMRCSVNLASVHAILRRLVSLQTIASSNDFSLPVS
jgi:hypothetical protein